MELVGFVLFFLSVIFLLLALAQLVGFGWAMAIVDLLTFQASANYSELQNNYPKTKTNRGRKIGILFLVLAICCISITLLIL